MNGEIDEQSSEQFKNIISRIEEIEARQREYNMHDPDCPARKTEKLNALHTMYYTPQKCTCWLNNDQTFINPEFFELKPSYLGATFIFADLMDFMTQTKVDWLNISEDESEG